MTGNREGVLLEGVGTDELYRTTSHWPMNLFKLYDGSVTIENKR